MRNTITSSAPSTRRGFLGLVVKASATVAIAPVIVGARSDVTSAAGATVTPPADDMAHASRDELQVWWDTLDWDR